MIKRFIISILNYTCICLIRKSFYFQNNPLKSILVIAPHPDDEILGLGGLMIKLAEQKTSISIIYLTDGENSAVWPDKNEIKKQRILMSEMVCRSLGIKDPDIFRLHIEDGKIPSESPVVIDSISSIIEQIRPDAVFTTHPDDYWPTDHVAAAGLVSEAIRKSSHKPELWFFWVWCWYNMRPRDLFRFRYRNLSKIRTEGQLQEKTELMNIYLKKLTPDGKPWSGILPESLLKAVLRPFEIIEKAD